MTERCRWGFYVQLIDFTGSSVHFLCSQGHIGQTAQKKLAGEDCVV
jgi:hypothetical protein